MSHKVDKRKLRSIAAIMDNRWQLVIDKAAMHMVILKASISCERWGFDAMRYTFKDKSHLIFCDITKDWIM